MPEQSTRPGCPADPFGPGASVCPARPIATVFIILLLAACGPGNEEEWGVALVDPAIERSPSGVDLVTGIDFEPSPAMLDALHSGVAITLSVQTRATTGRLWLPGLDRLRKHRLEISYLPLSRHYQVEYQRDGRLWNYPRLGMLIQDLRERRELAVKIEPDELAEDDWRVQARVELDRSQLPSPMRLPAWFDPQWRVFSEWREWSTAELPDDDQ